MKNGLLIVRILCKKYGWMIISLIRILLQFFHIWTNKSNFKMP